MRRIVGHAVASRLVTLAIARAAFAAALSFDESAALAAVAPSLRFLVRWDAFADLEIARGGYGHEQLAAFGPLYPLLIRAAANTLPISPAAAGVLVSNFCFVLAVVLFYRLSRATFADRAAAERAAIYLAWNPASIFCSAVYFGSKEPLVAACSFLGMYLWSTRRAGAACVAMVCAALTRSNGILLGGFFFYSFARSLLAKQLTKGDFLLPLYGLAPLAAFLAHQRSVAARLCVRENASAPYCRAALPNVYSHAQAKYWDVGPFRYWNGNELGNWLLAAGMLCVCGDALRRWTRAQRQRHASVAAFLQASSGKCKGMLDAALLPHMALLAAFLAYFVVFAHIQVITRVMVAFPVPWWYAAHVHAEPRAGPLMRCWAAAYFAANTVLYALFYPPA